MAKESTATPVCLTDAIYATLRTCGELSAPSVAADLSSQIAFGELQIEGWDKVRPTPELVKERTSRVKVALLAMVLEDRVKSEHRGELTYWFWLPPKTEPKDVQRGLF